MRYMELAEKDPWLTDGSTDTVEQIRGMGVVAKRALDVMQCEVNRLLVLSSHALIPLSYIVPRKVRPAAAHKGLTTQPFKLPKS